MMDLWRTWKKYHASRHKNLNLKQKSKAMKSRFAVLLFLQSFSLSKVVGDNFLTFDTDTDTDDPATAGENWLVGHSILGKQH